MSAEAVYRIHHRRFGELEIPATAVLQFDSLPGFAGSPRLALLEHDQRSPFAWLVSLDDPDLAFVVTEPRRFFVDYAPVPAPQHRRAIGIESGDEYELLAIATLRADSATLNLAAPILVNPRTRQATQAILDESRHPLRAELRFEALARPAAAEPPRDQIESKPHR